MVSTWTSTAPSPGARDMPPRDRLAYLIREGAVLGLLLYAIAAAVIV